MIRKTIENTKLATFVVHTPIKEQNDFPAPSGTGFFISSDGYFITAQHVVKEVTDFSKIHFSLPEVTMVKHITHVKDWPEYDISLLKTDFLKNNTRELFKEREDFPYLEPDFNNYMEGTPVYSYGFPLPETFIRGNFGFVNINTRVTSAVISSTKEKVKAFRSPSDAKFYSIDNSLIYGNSGGPVILQESGKVIGLCVRFQPVPIIQNHLQGKPQIFIPTSYAIVSSLSNVKDYLQQHVYKYTIS